MPPLRRVLVSILLLLLLAPAAACRSDGGGGAGATTSSTDPSTTTTTDGPGTTTTVPGSGRPLNESDLVEVLLEPAELAEGLDVDAALGTGELVPGLCAEVSLDVTWEDQASQALTSGSSESRLVVTQSVLAFDDAATAAAFVDEVLDGLVTCQPALEVAALDGVGDRTVTLGAGPGEAHRSGALVLVEERVSYLTAIAPPHHPGGEVITPDVLALVATRLAV